MPDHHAYLGSVKEMSLTFLFNERASDFLRTLCVLKKHGKSAHGAEGGVVLTLKVVIGVLNTGCCKDANASLQHRSKKQTLFCIVNNGILCNVHCMIRIKFRNKNYRNFALFYIDIIR